ncbi:hypothetical protein JCGZ_18517 [Jatropha curcas]|uniref:Cytochrome P450 n=1 Tax=Jatropha curcas TaxID=180498 RepID=A0A067K4H1_JATCU|nr:cytochrome P450 CYP82D47 [Jatropha curcas]KDP29948.1 hypothetical protein JCGZ_18517 [Jatropha curcas]
MEFLSPLCESLDIIILSILAPVILFSFFLISRKRSANNKKRLPPEAAGGWPIVGHLPLLSLSKAPYITLGKIADKLGPLFTIRLGVHRALIVSSWEMAKECYSTNDEAFASRPKALFFDVMGYNYAMIGATPYGEYWRQIRKISTLKLLSNYRLDLLRHVRETEVKEAVGGLYKKWMKNKSSSGKLVVEMKNWFWDLNLNVILKMVVGKRYVEYINGEDESNEESDTWQNTVRDFFELAGKFAVSDALPFLRWLDVGGVEKAMKKTMTDMDEIMDRWLQEHKQKKAKPEEEDLMDVLMSALDDENTLFTQDAGTINKATCLSLILAASDIVRAALTWTLSLILNNPNVLKKAKQELYTHIGQDRQVQDSDVKNLVYLQAIVKEALRLYPPGPVSVPRECIKDCSVGGYHIPAGTRLIVNISRIHRDPRVWSNPSEFEPERFLSMNIDVKGKNPELIPFGSGRRMCPGATFALQILNLTLASFLHAFEIETPSGKPVDMSEGTGIINLKATPLEVALTPRLSAHLY